MRITMPQKTHNMPASCHVMEPGTSNPEHESRTVKLELEARNLKPDCFLLPRISRQNLTHFFQNRTVSRKKGEYIDRSAADLI